MITWHVRGVLHYTDLFEKHGKCQSWDLELYGAYEGHATNNSAQQVRPIVLTLVRLHVQLYRPYVHTVQHGSLLGSPELSSDLTSHCSSPFGAPVGQFRLGL